MHHFRRFASFSNLQQYAVLHFASFFVNLSKIGHFQLVNLAHEIDDCGQFEAMWCRKSAQEVETISRFLESTFEVDFLALSRLEV